MKTARIAVVGSALVDYTFFTSRFPGDGETVVGDEFLTGPGGKGSNQATAAARAGGEVVMVTKLGEDSAAGVLRRHYETEGLDRRFVYSTSGIATGGAAIEVNRERGENRIIMIKGANEKLTLDDIRRAAPAIAAADILLVQLEINLDAIAEAMAIAARHGVRIVMNPAPAQPVPEGFFTGVDFFTPNETEAAFYSGLPVTSREEAVAAGRRLLELGVRNVVITLGRAGALYVSESEVHPVPTPPVRAIDTTGAGDTFNGAFAVALGEGFDTVAALRFANCAAAISVTRKGTSPATPRREEIEALLRQSY